MNTELQETTELLSQNTSKGQAPDPRLGGMAVVGLGYWGPNWVRVIDQMHHSAKIVCCDFSRKRLEAAKRLHPAIECTERLEVVTSDPEIEAVVVATPVSTHYEIARRCLMAGKSVLVEKPLAMSSRHTAELVRLAREQRVILMVGHTF